MSIAFFASTRFSTSWYLLIWASVCRWFCRAVLWICCSTTNNRTENVRRFLPLSKRISKISIGCASCLMFHKKEEGCVLWLNRKKCKNHHRSPRWRQFASRCITTKPAPTIKNIWIESTSHSLTAACKKNSNTSSEKKDSFVFPIFHNIVAIKLLTCCSILFHFSTGVPHPFQEIMN